LKCKKSVTITVNISLSHTHTHFINKQCVSEQHKSSTAGDLALKMTWIKLKDEMN